MTYKILYWRDPTVKIKYLYLRPAVCPPARTTLGWSIFVVSFSQLAEPSPLHPFGFDPCQAALLCIATFLIGQLEHQVSTFESSWWEPWPALNMILYKRPCPRPHFFTSTPICTRLRLYRLLIVDSSPNSLHVFLQSLYRWPSSGGTVIAVKVVFSMVVWIQYSCLLRWWFTYLIAVDSLSRFWVPMLVMASWTIMAPWFLPVRVLFLILNCFILKFSSTPSSYDLHALGCMVEATDCWRQCFMLAWISIAR